MISFVNAKINVGLQVVRRRPDGYHELRTIFMPVGVHSGTPGESGGLCDVLEVTPSHYDSFSLYGNAIDCPDDSNIVLKALRKYREVVPAFGHVMISLDKHLPSGAGMGGGSADAAFALRMFNDLSAAPLDEQQLHAVAAGVGADVPFFLINRPCYATGIGEMLERIEIPVLKSKWLAVLKPMQSISTAQAFSMVTPHEPDLNLIDAVRAPLETWHEVIVNDFETSMFAIHPELRSIKDYLYDSGAIYASMTGSGSAFYGIFNDRDSAWLACERADVTYTAVTSLRM